jgi:hypothetical protein
MATAMFKAANTPECYADEKDDIKTEFIVLLDRQNTYVELTSIIDDVPTSTETGNAKWRPPDRK